MESCRICGLGTHGNITDRTYCELCPSGYYCPPGTGHGDTNPCPIGNDVFKCYETDIFHSSYFCFDLVSLIVWYHQDISALLEHLPQLHVQRENMGRN